MADVLDVFGRLNQGFIKHAMYSSELTLLFEKQWKQQEQPLILLAFMLHPKYVVIFRSMTMHDNRLSVMAMTNYAILYCKKFIGDDFVAIRVNQWYYGQLPAAELYSSQEHFWFWNTMSSSVDVLNALTSKILSFIV